MKPTIFDLYQKEKEIILSDDQDNSVKITLRKLTEGQREKCKDAFEKEKTKQTELFRKGHPEYDSVKLSIDTATPEDVAQRFLLPIESGRRARVLDLIPVDEDVKPEDKEKTQNKLLKQWEKKRLKALKELPPEEIKQLALEATLETLAVVKAISAYDYQALVFMCYDEDGKQIFENIDSIGDVAHASIIDKLLEESAEFRKVETGMAIREVSTSTPFSSTSDSEKK